MQAAAVFPFIMVFVMVAGIFVFSGVLYFLNAYPLYKIGKKLDYDKNFLPWIPVAQILLCLFTLGDLSGLQDFHISPRLDKLFRVSTRKKSYVTVIATTIISYALVYLGLFAMYFVFFIIAFFTVEMSGDTLPEENPVFFLMPLLMMAFYGFAMLISAVSTFILSSFQYAYLRDLIGVFNPDIEHNKKTALVVVILNNFSMGLAVPIYLLTLSGKEPLPIAPEGIFAEETAPISSFAGFDPENPPYYPEVNYLHNNEAITQISTEDAVEDIDGAPAENTDTESTETELTEEESPAEKTEE